MALLNKGKQVKGSTLIETLVAMTIILISLVFSGIILLNILNLRNNRQNFRAHILLNELAIKTKSERRFVDENIEDGNIVFQKTTGSYNGIKNLYIQSVEASDKKGKVLDEYKELIFVPE